MWLTTTGFRTQRQSVLDAIELARAGKDGAEIKRRLEETQKDSVIYVTVDTLKYLKREGVLRQRPPLWERF